MCLSGGKPDRGPPQLLSSTTCGIEIRSQNGGTSKNPELMSGRLLASGVLELDGYRIAESTFGLYYLHVLVLHMAPAGKRAATRAPTQFPAPHRYVSLTKNRRKLSYQPNTLMSKRILAPTWHRKLMGNGYNEPNDW